MADFIHPELETVRENPDPNKQIRLVLICGGSDALDGATAQVSQNGGEIVDTLPEEILVIEVPEPMVDKVCDYSGVESVSPDETMALL